MRNSPEPVQEEEVAQSHRLRNVGACIVFCLAAPTVAHHAGWTAPGSRIGNTKAGYELDQGVGGLEAIGEAFTVPLFAPAVSAISNHLPFGHSNASDTPTALPTKYATI